MEPVLTKKTLADAFLVEFREKLKLKLTWLNQSFGRAQKLIRVFNGEVYTYPGIYIGNNEYFEAAPNDSLGNFAFWDLKDPLTPMQASRYSAGTFEQEAALIVWVNLNTIYTTETGRAIDQLKADVWAAVNNITTPGGMFQPEEIYETWNNVYNGYDLQEQDGQFLMHPYAAIRIEGKIRVYSGNRC